MGAAGWAVQGYFPRVESTSQRRSGKVEVGLEALRFHLLNRDCQAVLAAVPPD
jgi:hypothetical protein